MPLEELTELLQPLPRFRAAQIFKWIARGACGFGEMDNLPLALRNELTGRFFLRPAVTEEKFPGDDGTIKLALQFENGARIEAVLLSGGLRSNSPPTYTACLSTQVGCPAGCVFCKTGALGFLRDLNSAEIVEQFLLLRKAAQETIDQAISAGHCQSFRQAENPPARSVSNIVVMGMGEPLLNLAELRRALDVITSAAGMNLSRRRITVSTCGIAGGIVDLADNGPAVRLALSLTTADEGLRRRLMPLTKGQNLSNVRDACGYFQKRTGGRITLEVVLLGGINTSGKDAAGIAEFAKNLDAVINLIPWNPVPGLEFEGFPLRSPGAKETTQCKADLEKFGLKVTLRMGKGGSISGACGQLGKV